MISSTKKARRLVLFNHKGGVGKTTLTVNIAHALAESGKRVLLVDTDPQCSLSSYFLEEDYLDSLLDASERPGGQTIWSALKPVSEGVGPIQPIEAIRVGHNLHLAVGDIRLADFENTLGDAWTWCLNRNRRGYHCTSGISALVDRMVDDTHADYVFFDAGPNVGPLNRAVMLDCSHFVVPAACDLFSTRAIKTLGFTIADWVSIWSTVREIAPEGIQLLPGRPQFAGYIPQAFRVYRGEMAKSPLSAIAGLEDGIITYVWRPLQRASGVAPTKDAPVKLKIGEVKYFGSLVADAQLQGQPLWQVSGGTSKAKSTAKLEFGEIAKELVSITA